MLIGHWPGEETEGEKGEEGEEHSKLQDKQE